MGVSLGLGLGSLTCSTGTRLARSARPATATPTVFITDMACFLSLGDSARLGSSLKEKSSVYDARRVGSGVRGRGWVVRGLGSTAVRTECFRSNLKYLEEEGDADWLERAARDEAPCPCDVLRDLCRERHHPNQELCGDDRMGRMKTTA